MAISRVEVRVRSFHPFLLRSLSYRPRHFSSHRKKAASQFKSRNSIPFSHPFPSHLSNLDTYTYKVLPSSPFTSHLPCPLPSFPPPPSPLPLPLVPPPLPPSLPPTSPAHHPDADSPHDAPHHSPSPTAPKKPAIRVKKRPRWGLQGGAFLLLLLSISKLLFSSLLFSSLLGFPLLFFFSLDFV